MRHLNAERRRQAIAHGAEAARGHPAVRLLEAEELRRPHLVLTDFGGDVDVTPARRLEQPLDRELRQDDIAVLLKRLSELETDPHRVSIVDPNDDPTKIEYIWRC